MAIFLLLFGGSWTLSLKAWLSGSREETGERSQQGSEIVFLKTELEKLKNFADEIPQRADQGETSAFIYSTYPFSNKHLLTVSAGARQGVREGAVALTGSRILLGRVVRVFSETSLIETIFDPSFELPVRIGEHAENALLKGGAVPRLDLIEKKARINVGDSVYSAGSAFPYGVPVGMIEEMKSRDFDAFKSATLALPYNLNELRALLLVEYDAL